MAIFHSKNYSKSHLSKLDGVAQNGDTFINCNFAQPIPNTAIFSGLTGLTFQGCNLCNCNVPGDSVIDDCLTIQKSQCSHIHPNLLAQGHISACPDDCSHVVDTDEIWIDGVKTDTIYHYKDTTL
ncbi:MAG: hypothetical protein GWN62_12050 [Aliifodinibius sp.]|nr:hypothetical protein [Fodinibius sp.]